ncbi:tryptophan halogenase, putative [Rubellimicrobium mesophilum DSM 19309]|uniref:Tryptophan halogenase, putative n=1 Tax=Rubellimicrobium mesophilum DSM 19309 TaxID=442562 RepID=A0A017HWG3_9RHOB|nr:tryptophan halogenase, putative [Rubellimicrobium mesophilum DSM 19309]
MQEAHLFQHLIWKKRGPFAEVNGKRVPAGPFHYAFHFDQALVGAWLRKKAKGIRHLDAQVTGVETGGDGVAALHLDTGERVDGDLFIDASGFRRRLVSELPFEWVSFSEMLPNNRALPFWLDLKDGEEIDPVTGAWAQGHGWMWKIPTQGRFGCGYVFCDAYISIEEAQAEIERALGHPIEPRGDIRINPGRQPGRLGGERRGGGACVVLPRAAGGDLDPRDHRAAHLPDGVDGPAGGRGALQRHRRSASGGLSGLRAAALRVGAA